MKNNGRTTIFLTCVASICLCNILFVPMQWNLLRIISHSQRSSTSYDDNLMNKIEANDFFFSTLPVSVVGPCAINLYGLPRQFKDLVLPSLIKNVIRPNLHYHCDYFVHYYDQKSEYYDRGADTGRMGTIDPEEVKLLKDVVHREHQVFMKRSDIIKKASRAPAVHFQSDTEESFNNKYNPLLDRIHREKGADGKLLYMPLNEKEPFPDTSITNIIKMWHSQESVWNLMTDWKNPKGSVGADTTPFHYSRVAMLRIDVMYVTPIDLYRLPDGKLDVDNRFGIVPDFSKYPVNDRMFYGPADATKIWAASRFIRLRDHADYVAKVRPGDGIHPERFLYHTIFPAIQDAGIEIVNYPSTSLCFLRVRSDGSIRIGDCGTGCVNSLNQQYVESLIQRPCALNTTNPDVPFLECNDDFIEKEASTDDTDRDKLLWQGCNWKS